MEKLQWLPEKGIERKDRSIKGQCINLKKML